MASLTYAEKDSLERILQMRHPNPWYVLNFSDTTFESFVYEYTWLNIHDVKYQEIWTSKAKKLRKFFELEHDTTVANLLLWFAEYDYIDNMEDKQKLTNMAVRLRNNGDIDEVIWNIVGRTSKFSILKREIMEHSRNDRYIESLDRIHTLFQDYLLQLCVDLEVAWFHDQEPPNVLLSRIKSKLLENNTIVNDSFVEKSLWSITRILGHLQNVRNNEALTHAHGETLSFADAKFTVGLISICLSYLNQIIEAQPD